MNELNWDTISDQDKTAVIKKDVKLIEDFDMPRFSSSVKLWKSSNFGMDLQAQHRNLSSSSTASSSSSSSSVMPSLRNVNAAANSLMTTASGEINWPSVAWMSVMAPTTTYSNPKELLEANREKRVVGVQKKKKSQKNTSGTTGKSI
jgi:hypothetical protein